MRNTIIGILSCMLLQAGGVWAESEMASPVDAFYLQGLLQTAVRAEALNYPAYIALDEVMLLEDTQSFTLNSPALRALSNAADPQVRLRALEAEWMTGDSPPLERLIPYMNDPAPLVRNAAADRLAQMDTDLVFQHLLKTFEGNDPLAIAALDLALPAMGRRLEPSSRACLMDETAPPGYRRTAAYCLGRIGATGAAPLLREAAFSPDRDLSYTCTEALYALRTAPLAAAWPALLDHPDPDIHAIALNAIAESGQPQALPLLSRIASGRAGYPADEQRFALEAITWRPLSLCLPTLIDLAEQTPHMSDGILQWLNLATGQNFGYDYATWRAWYAQGMPVTSSAPMMPRGGSAPPRPTVPGKNSNSDLLPSKRVINKQLF